jgi:hypothetical protein
MHDWKVIYILPNLSLPRAQGAMAGGAWIREYSLGSELVAIVPTNDPRVKAAAERSTGIKRLVASFRDNYNNALSASALIVRADAPQRIADYEDAIIAFRNSAGIATVLRPRARSFKVNGSVQGVYTDIFDCHPSIVSPTGRVATITPANNTLFSADAPVRSMASAYQPVTGGQLIMDEYLHRALGFSWRRRYEDGKRDRSYERTLFRSLEVAYRAAALGAVTLPSIHDYGIQVALWVSAMEILAWPRTGHASLPSVLTIIGGYPWATSRLRSARYRGYGGRKGSVPMDAAQRACSLLYRARNRFLHGEPVGVNTLLARAGKRVPLPDIAAILYRTVLVEYLRGKHPLELKRRKDWGRSLHESLSHGDYDRALATAFGIPSTEHRSMRVRKPQP